VWCFLDRFELPVCELYAHGYTSLGKRADTAPNPALLRADGSYGHARELLRPELERAGRLQPYVSNLQPYAMEAAPLCDRRCTPMRWRLQPFAIGPATLCDGGRRHT